MYAYGKAGISLPHYTGDQYNAGRHVAESDLRPGDLIFFGSDLHHMGMYVGNGQLIHAPHSGDVVRIASLSGWFQDNYAGAVRIAG
jgi:cell wall-associated NlpC family hydrolase